MFQVTVMALSRICAVTFTVGGRNYSSINLVLLKINVAPILVLALYHP